MTCRHAPGDLSCSKYGYGSAAPISPDIDNYEVIDAKALGNTLVLKVKYPNCANCAFEGIKIMVYEHVSMVDALKWRRIDPHFRSPETDAVRTSAPAPVARFPGSDVGWNRALAFAVSISASNKRGPNG